MKALDAKHGKFDLVLCVGDFFGPPKDEEEPYTEDDEAVQLLEGKLEGRVRSVFSPVCSTHRRAHDAVPVECYIMQGEHPLPGPVIEKFAKTGSALTKGVNLLRMFHLISD